MIELTDNRAGIISLWKNVFGDSEEEISFFIDNAKGADCLSYSENGRIISMLYLVDCIVKNKKGKYIYAACTDKEFEGRGLMSSLISYAKNMGYCYLCLIPANDGLIDFYKKRGFEKTAEIEDLSFIQTDEIKEYLFEGYDLTKPLVMICEV